MHTLKKNENDREFEKYNYLNKIKILNFKIYIIYTVVTWFSLVDFNNLWNVVNKVMNFYFNDQFQSLIILIINQIYFQYISPKRIS